MKPEIESSAQWRLSSPHVRRHTLSTYKCKDSVHKPSTFSLHYITIIVIMFITSAGSLALDWG